VIELRGIYAPVTTPFDPFTGDADLVALRRNLRSWLRAPLAGFVLFGSTGEGPLLDEAERPRLIEGARELGEGRLLLAAVGAESTRASMRLARAAAAAGVDAVLVPPPSYYRPALTADALRDHYRAVADASPVPVVLYQVPPQFSGIELRAGLVGELSRHPNIVGIKDSSGDLKQLGAYLDACDRSCAVLVGSGASLFGALEMGAAGGILAVALLAPHDVSSVYRLREDGDLAGAGRLQERIKPVDRAIGARFGIAGIKAALDLLGLAGGEPRPPLQPLREKQRAEVRAVLTEAGLLEPAEGA
jgi:4-hydroxy-2-oxoglutarate aldolase